MVSVDSQCLRAYGAEYNLTLSSSSQYNLHCFPAALNGIEAAKAVFYERGQAAEAGSND